MDWTRPEMPGWSGATSDQLGWLQAELLWELRTLRDGISWLQHWFTGKGHQISVRTYRVNANAVICRAIFPLAPLIIMSARVLPLQAALPQGLGCSPAALPFPLSRMQAWEEGSLAEGTLQGNSDWVQGVLLSSLCGSEVTQPTPRQELERVSYV